MNRRRLEAGDHDNKAFEIVGADSHHVKPGFHPGEEVSETQEKEGAVRFPHRRAEEDVPSASLADRLRGGRRKQA
jgi:hypothetical protein